MPKFKHAINVGCDPEAFAGYRDKATYDKDFLPHGIFAYSPAAFERFLGVRPLGGDDKHPIYIDEPNFRFVGDGVAFELNMKRPYSNENPAEFYNHIRSGFDFLSDWLDKHGYFLHHRPVVNFDYKKFWTEELLEDKRFYWGTIFGCDPDEDAFNVEWSASILNNETHPFRYGGGHWHMSGIPKMFLNRIPFVKLLAVFLGCYAIANSPFPQEEILRAFYYGKPGKNRPQKYPDGSTGVEYRTPSNAIFAAPYDVFEGAFEMIDLAITGLLDSDKGRRILFEFEDQAVRAITTANRELAQDVYTQAKRSLV